MVTTKKYMRNIHETLQDGQELNNIANSLIIEFNEFETELDNMKKSVQIDTAVGIELDNIASIFGISREQSETDSQFRARIKSFFPGTIGSGTINDLKQTVSRMTGLSESEISIIELESNKFRIGFFIGPDFSLINTVKDIVWNIKAAGIYPFFDIQSGFEDTLNFGTDNIILTVTNRFYLGNTTWGDTEW